ncbi:hypothetical protein [Nitrospirillum bahiense]|uniref:hypothetical protein n=1 Tax=Nitrospirillum amazonense TaxID=28077 RepID=UPI0011A225DD|nr:hypothetical protein [Nitrospirillum amazonense]
MQNQPTPKGDLAPYAVSVNQVEQAAGFVLPLPAGIDKAVVGAVWPAGTGAFQKQKQINCHPH